MHEHTTIASTWPSPCSSSPSPTGPGAVSRASSTVARPVLALPRRASPRHDRDGSLRHRALLGPRGRELRSPRRAAAAARRSPVRAAQQDRRRRRQAPCSRRCATTRSARSPSRPSTSTCSPALHRMRSGWMATRTARLNTCAVSCASSASRSRSARRASCLPCTRSARRASSALPAPLRLVLARGRDGDRRAREAHARDRALARDACERERARRAAAHRAWRRPAHRHGARRLRRRRRPASRPDVTSRATSDSRRASPRAACKRQLGRISKRGDPYLRMLLIHGARSVLCHAKRATAPRDRLARLGARSRGARADTTRPPSRLPTSSRASSGRSGAASSRSPRARRTHPPN